MYKNIDCTNDNLIKLDSHCSNGNSTGKWEVAMVLDNGEVDSFISDSFEQANKVFQMLKRLNESKMKG